MKILARLKAFFSPPECEHQWSEWQEDYYSYPPVLYFRSCKLCRKAQVNYHVDFNRNRKNDQ